MCCRSRTLQKSPESITQAIALSATVNIDNSPTPNNAVGSGFWDTGRVERGASLIPVQKVCGIEALNIKLQFNP